MKIFVKVKPNSNKEEIKMLEEGKFVISLTSPAEKNKANLDLVKVLSKHFGVSHKEIIIKAGLSNREKIIEIK
jgi:uncharacterized protein (TIGR00251 family)